MKLTTLNLFAFFDWEKRKSAIVDYLKQTNPDIIFFQEVVFLPGESPYNQVQLLNQELGYPYEHSAVTRLQPSTEYDTYREGLGMLSKHPVIKTDTIVLKKEAGDEHNRIVQFADVMVDGKKTLLANVHFSMTDVTDFATPHLKETLEIIANQNEARIIAGDFNIDNIEESAYLWQDKYEASTKVPYISYPSMNKRNDYVLVPKPFTITHISVSDENLSDHTAVTVEIDTLL